MISTVTTSIFWIKQDRSKYDLSLRIIFVIYIIITTFGVFFISYHHLKIKYFGDTEPIKKIIQCETQTNAENMNAEIKR